MDWLRLGPHRIRILHEANYVVADGRFRAGVPGPPLHHHDWDEGFYVVSGAFDVVVDGRTQHLQAGDFGLAPAGSTHTFSVAGKEPAVLLATFSDTKAADYLRAMSAAFSPDGTPDHEAMAAARSTFGVTAVV